MKEDNRIQTLRMYYYNAKRFEISNTPLKCEKCSESLQKLDYIKNFGFCDTCRKKADEQAQKIKQQDSECLKYLRENNLI